MRLTREELTALLADQEPPCVSIYQTTHLHHPYNQQDLVRFRNFLAAAGVSLPEKYPACDPGAILGRFQALAEEMEFWTHRSHGLAVLGSPTVFKVFELHRPVSDLLVVGDNLHVKPLLRILQSAARFQILCLNRHAAKLYEGNRDGLDRVDLSGIPSTIGEALGSVLTEPNQTAASHVRSFRGNGQAIHHVNGAMRDEIDIDIDRFFRVIDRAILEHFSRPSGLPLMLAALPEYHAPFRAISHNPHLMAEGIMLNSDAVSVDQLRDVAWRKVEPRYLQRLGKMVDDFQLGKSRQLASDDLDEVAAAARTGRVGTLLVEANRCVPGRIECDTGHVRLGGRDAASPEDVLDDLAELTLRMKGEVVVIPEDKMPSTTGVAATYRF